MSDVERIDELAEELHELHKTCEDAFDRLGKLVTKSLLMNEETYERLEKCELQLCCERRKLNRIREEKKAAIERRAHAAPEGDSKADS